MIDQEFAERKLRMLQDQIAKMKFTKLSKQ